MFNINENPVWEENVQGWEPEDFVEGGVDGADNLPLKQLANRTAYLKGQITAETENREESEEGLRVNLQQQIDGMKGRGGYLTAYDFGKANPTQSELTQYALGQIGQTDQTKIWNSTHVKNLNNSHVWVLNNTPDTSPAVFEWIDDGLDSVGVGNNDGVAGVVSGGNGFDSVYIDPQGKMSVPGLHTFQADQVEGYGRDLMKVILGHGIEEMNTQALRNEAIASVMANIRIRCNNNGEIDGSGVPDFRGIAVADFLDGLDLSAIGSPTGGQAPQAWNDGYKNNRLLIGGFNSYKSSGDTEVSKNHIVMVTRNLIAQARVNAANDNAGGYVASELRAWLDGTAGNGTGPFAAGLKAALGGNNPIITIRKLLSTKGNWEWKDYTVFPLSTLEVFGAPGWAEQEWADGVSVFLPIYQKGSQYRVKCWNGGRMWWWLSSPSASSAAYFCLCHYCGHSSYYSASAVGGVAPAFCVA